MEKILNKYTAPANDEIINRQNKLIVLLSIYAGLITLISLSI